jgi:hypothetical protein
MTIVLAAVEAVLFFMRYRKLPAYIIDEKD